MHSLSLIDGLASGLLGVGSMKYVKFIYSEALQGRPYIGDCHPASGLRIAAPQPPSLTAMHCTAVMHELYTLQSLEHSGMSHQRLQILQYYHRLCPPLWGTKELISACSVHS